MFYPSKHFVFSITLFALIAFIWTLPVTGQPESLDPTFNGTGYVRTGFGYGRCGVNTSEVQPDGKILVAGVGSNGDDYSFMIARYSTDGIADQTFGENGIVFTSLGGTYGVRDVVLQEDGKIIAVGSIARSSAYQFTLVRYNPDGSLDQSFGSAGVVFTDIGPGSDSAQSLAIQNDGKILVIGSTSLGMALVRYGNDGTLDSSFGGDAIVTSVGTWGSSLDIQADGKIVVGGSAPSANLSYYRILRYNSNGTPDTTFDGDGAAETQVGNRSDWGTSVVVKSNAKILLAGRSWFKNRIIVSMAQFNPDGSLDSSFDGDGKLLLPSTGLQGEEVSIAVQPDGKVLFTTDSYSDARGQFTAGRINVDGTLDLSFGNNGLIFTPSEPTSYQSIANIALDGNGRVLVVGDINQTVFIRRFNPTGNTDKTFGSNGSMTANVGDGGSVAQAVALQPDGKIITAGYGYPGQSLDVFLARHNRDGSLDQSFGNLGKVETGSTEGHEQAFAVGLQADGKIVAAGKKDDNFVVFRFLSNGALDPTFGTNGEAVTAFPSRGSVISAILIQPDGKIIAVGSTYELFGSFPPYLQRNHDCAITRYRADGTLDPTFGNGGKVTTSLNPYSDMANSVALQADGKIVVAGQGAYFAVIRYNADGTLDSTFNSTGIVETPVGTGIGKSSAHGVAIQSDGKIVLSGVSYQLYTSPEVNDFAIVRYNTDGSLDQSFYHDGKVVTPFGTGGNTNSSVAIQENGRILIAGTTRTAAGKRSVVLRFHANGLSDTLWGFAGSQVADVPRENIGNAMFLDSVGRPFVAGSIRGAFGIVKFRSDRASDSSITLSGRVLTSSGRGLAGVTITLSSENGLTSRVRTNQLGRYSFSSLPLNETVTISAAAYKRYSFTPQIVTLSADITNLNFVATN